MIDKNKRLIAAKNSVDCVLKHKEISRVREVSADQCIIVDSGRR